MTKNRLAWIDIAKGIGILLVVLGHTMSPVMGEHIVTQRIYKVLYTFHMPLFFLLSGLLSGKLVSVDPRSRKALLVKRAKRLLIPYFVWAIIYFPMRIVLKQHVRFTQSYPLWTIVIGNNPAGQLWFLYVLFILSAITILFVNQKNIQVWCTLGLAVSFFAPLIPPELSLPGIGLSFSLYQIGFFFLGVRLIAHRDTVFDNAKLALLCGIIGGTFIFATLCGVQPWYANAISAVCICYLVCFGAHRLKSGRIYAFLTYLGRHSMDIYILHAPLLVIGRVCLKSVAILAPWAYVVILTACAIAISLLASKWVIRKIKLLRCALLGEGFAT